jgi:hypothetical protein
MTAQRAVQRLSRLVEDHLLAERLASGGMPLRAERVAIGEALCEAAAGAPGGAEVDAPTGLAVTADRALLCRALEALLAAAGREGTPVRAEARAAAGAATVTVRGAPVAPEALELPQRGSGSDPSGRSLGLMAAAAVAEAHGALLTCRDGALVLSWPAAG